MAPAVGGVASASCRHVVGVGMGVEAGQQPECPVRGSRRDRGSWLPKTEFDQQAWRLLTSAVGR